MLSDETIREYENQLDGDEEIEDTLRRLREDGYSRKEAVQVLLGVLDLSLAEAKRVLVTSDTWGDAFDAAQDETSSSSSSVPPAPG